MPVRYRKQRADFAERFARFSQQERGIAEYRGGDRAIVDDVAARAEPRCSRPPANSIASI